METRYTSQQLEKIVDEATIYMCACPAQVAVQLRHLRELYRYQTHCQLDPGNDHAVRRWRNIMSYKDAPCGMLKEKRKPDGREN